MRINKLVGVSLAAALLSVSAAFADMPAKEQFKEQIPVREPVKQQPLPEPVAKVEECCGWDFRLSAGVPVYFFKDEDTTATGGMYLDAFPCSVPINLRVGGEVRHMQLEQDGSEDYAEWPGKSTHITYVRVPFAVEYVQPLFKQTNLYLGGGPDIISTANDLTDTTVGGHLGGRLQYEWENHISLAVESGYMWGRVSESGESKMNLDGAYIIPTIGYRF